MLITSIHVKIVENNNYLFYSHLIINKIENEKLGNLMIRYIKKDYFD